MFFTKTVLKPTRTQTQNKEKHNFGLTGHGSKSMQVAI